MPEVLPRFWIRYADKSKTDGYSALKENVRFCQEWMRKAGLRFQLPKEIREKSPKVVPIGTQEVLEQSVVQRLEFKAEEQRRACSSVGRAPGLQPGGREFEPPQVHQV